MFEQLLLTLKTDMMSLCAPMMLLAKALAALGCLVAIGMSCIKSMADNDPIDFWSFLRPISLGFCIIYFNTLVVGGLDGILQPIAKATSHIAETQETDYYEKSDRLEDAKSQMPPNPQVVYYLTKDEQAADNVKTEEDLKEVKGKDYEEIARKEMAADMEYKKTWILGVLESVLQVFSYAAKLIINIVGTFFLIILAIMGPLAFAAACFPVLSNSFTNWLSHYITVSLWLPIANLLTAVLSKANDLLCEQQLEALSVSGTANSILMLAMMVVGIFGYFSVPSVANWIVQAGGSGSYTRNMTQQGKQLGKEAASKASQLRNGIGNLLSRYGGGFKSVGAIIGKK